MSEIKRWLVFGDHLDTHRIRPIVSETRTMWHLPSLQGLMPDDFVLNIPKRRTDVFVLAATDEELAVLVGKAKQICAKHEAAIAAAAEATQRAEDEEARLTNARDNELRRLYGRPVYDDAGEII